MTEGKDVTLMPVIDMVMDGKVTPTRVGKEKEEEDEEAEVEVKEKEKEKEKESLERAKGEEKEIVCTG